MQWCKRSVWALLSASGWPPSCEDANTHLNYLAVAQRQTLLDESQGTGEGEGLHKAAAIWTKAPCIGSRTEH